MSDFPVESLAAVFGDKMVANDVGPRFTCFEADVVATALRDAGHHTEADVWINGHARGDGPDDAHYQCGQAS